MVARQPADLLHRGRFFAPLCHLADVLGWQRPETLFGRNPSSRRPISRPLPRPRCPALRNLSLWTVADSPPSSLLGPSPSPGKPILVLWPLLLRQRRSRSVSSCLTTMSRALPPSARSLIPRAGASASLPVTRSCSPN